MVLSEVPGGEAQTEKTFLLPDPSFLGAAALHYQGGRLANGDQIQRLGCLHGPLDLEQCSVTFSVETLVVLSSLLRKPGNRSILESAESLSEHPTFRRGNLGDQTSQDLGMFRSSNQLLDCLAWGRSCFRVLSGPLFSHLKKCFSSCKTLQLFPISNHLIDPQREEAGLTSGASIGAGRRDTDRF